MNLRFLGLRASAMAPTRRRGPNNKAKDKSQMSLGDLVLAKVKGFPAWPAKVFVFFLPRFPYITILSFFVSMLIVRILGFLSLYKERNVDSVLCSWLLLYWMSYNYVVNLYAMILYHTFVLWVWL